MLTRYIQIGIAITALVIAGAIFYFQNQLNKRILGNWQARFKVDQYKINRDQLESIDLQFNQDGSVTYILKTVKYIYDMTSAKNGTVDESGKNESSWERKGLFSVTTDRVRVRLSKSAQTIKFHEPFSIKDYNRDPGSDRPFVVLESRVAFDKQGHLILGEPDIGAGIIFGREGQSYENNGVACILNPRFDPRSIPPGRRERSDSQAVSLTGTVENESGAKMPTITKRTRTTPERKTPGKPMPANTGSGSPSAYRQTPDSQDTQAQKTYESSGTKKDFELALYNTLSEFSVARLKTELQMARSPFERAAAARHLGSLAFRQYVEPGEEIDSAEISNALLAAVKTDTDPLVRVEAASAWLNYAIYNSYNGIEFVAQALADTVTSDDSFLQYESWEALRAICSSSRDSSPSARVIAKVFDVFIEAFQKETQQKKKLRLAQAFLNMIPFIDGPRTFEPQKDKIAEIILWGLATQGQHFLYGRPIALSNRLVKIPGCHTGFAGTLAPPRR